MKMTAIERLEKQITEAVYKKAKEHDVVPEHWIHGWDEGFSFCRPCGLKKIKELEKEEPTEEYILDGGWIIEGDSEAFCETCERQLDNCFTDYACETAMEYFEADGLDL